MRLLGLLALLAACVGDKPETGRPSETGGETGQAHADLDGDGVSAPVDCDDADPSVYPGAPDDCDGVDDDCDGETDEDMVGGSVWYLDGDGDGYGLSEVSTWACEKPADYADNDLDCDDGDAQRYPGATERCDGADDDCDGVADEDTSSSVWYADRDEDGYGSADDYVLACEAPAGFTDNAEDCDDGDSQRNPGAEERCDGVDQDCDDVIDEDSPDSLIVYLDYDGDGYGNPDYMAEGCLLADGWVEDATDCDDVRDDVYPGAEERCDDADNDCDGLSDDDPTDGTTYFPDEDGDGVGGAGEPLLACALPDGYGEDESDCDDADPSVYPGVAEVCGDGVDNDCDGGKGTCGVEGEITAAEADLTLLGQADSDYLGRSAASGDVDGDGVADLLVGAPGVDSGSLRSVGAVYLVSGPISPGLVEYVAGAAFLGPLTASYGYAGWAAAAVDLDGDGLSEIVSGAYGKGSGRGEVMVWSGGSGYAGDYAASTADALVTGEYGADYLGFAVADAGDLDGDGLRELLIGAYGNDDGGSGAGAAYLFLGSSDTLSGSISADLADLVLDGDSSDSAPTQLGVALDGAGDLDGDGLDDLLIGAPGYDFPATDTGAVFVLLGASAPEGSIVIADVDAALGGTSRYDSAGTRVARAGDTDGDGYDDWLVGAPGADEGTEEGVGMALLACGSATISSSVAATATVLGARSLDYLGDGVGGAGDLDADGLADLALGAYGEDTAISEAGAAYVFFGPLSGASAVDEAGATFYGPDAGDGHVGRTLLGGLDADGDGAGDLVIGGPYVDTSAYDAGGLYVLLGGAL